MHAINAEQKAALVEQARLVIGSDPLLQEDPSLQENPEHAVRQFHEKLEKLFEMVARACYGCDDDGSGAYDGELSAVELSMFGKVVNINIETGEVVEIEDGGSLL